MNMTTVSVSMAVEQMSRIPVLVLGPAATSYSGAIDDVRQALLKRFSGLALPGSTRTYLELTDIVETLHSARTSDFRSAIVEEIDKLPPSPEVPVLAAVNWTAVVSLTPDTHFERALQDRLDRDPLSRTVTVVGRPNSAIPPRTIPAYRLLGLPHATREEEHLACSSADLLFKQAQWSSLLATLPDYLRQGALIFLGTAEIPEHCSQFLASLYSGPRPHPETLIFLKADPTYSLPTVSTILKRVSAQVTIVDGSLRELVGQIEILKLQRTGTQSTTTFGTDRIGKARAKLHAMSYLADVVPAPQIAVPGDALGRDIVDAMFRPSSRDWRPYQIRLPIERSISGELVKDCKALENHAGGLRVLSLQGAAGVGKTTVLKQLAVQLASENRIVLWCHRAVTESSTKVARHLLDAAKELLAADKKISRCVFIFLDDPWALRISVSDFMAQVEASGGSVVLVVGVRSSEYQARYLGETAMPGRPNVELTIQHELDPSELARLPQFLVRISGARNEEHARNIVLTNPYTNAADILCSLWFLVPDTRSQLQASLEDEYSRLGDATAAIEGVAAVAIRAGDVARAAYEAVTVASSLEVGLPVEVIVRALEIGYGDWMALADAGRPIWGLVYQEFEEVSDTYLYRTRNEIVTRVLLRLVNGPVGGHAGQYRLLKKLLAACTISSPAYRAFTRDVLVRARAKLEDMFSYEQGLDLYNTAIAASPYPDRSLEHHKGIWIKDVGRDLRAADAQLEKALGIADYPGSAREEPREFIHTSIAATVLAQVRDGQVSREAGFDKVSEHIKRASASPYFNANQAHVLANTYFEMAQIGGQKDDVVRLKLLNESLTEIERALQMIGAAGGRSIRYQKALSFFGDLQGKVIESVGDHGDLGALAERLFAESKNQIGFELQARRLLLDAVRSNKGKDYNSVSEYVEASLLKIRRAGTTPSVHLLATRADLVIRWRLQGAKGAVDWVQFAADLESILGTPKYRDDSLRKFYFAVALYQLGKITDANVVFTDLRRTTSVAAPNEIRCLYTGKEGFPKRFQASVRSGGGREYASIDELPDDVLVKGRLDVGPGGTEHVYIGFTGNGPVAVAKTASPEELLIPVA